jgi:diadenosine tetraphosphate (Ap4A) HIT family hydrolase
MRSTVDASSAQSRTVNATITSCCCGTISASHSSPSIRGYTLVAPLEHRTDVVGSFTETEYVELQRRVHRLGVAISASVPTERLYVLSLGSHQGNAHVHWHLAPLPPGVPYREQQYAALMHEHGHLDIPDDDLLSLAERARRALDA